MKIALNKKFAALMLGIGIGIAAAPAFASCAYFCNVDYKQCIADGTPAAECNADRTACYNGCGVPPPNDPGYTNCGWGSFPAC